MLGGESHALYSGIVGNRSYSSLTHYDQESAIGKALWHQITTVVILRKNMQQTTKSIQDHRFWLALDNMCYRSCTNDDLTCLWTRIVGPLKEQPSLSSKNSEMFLLLLHGTIRRME